MSKTNQNKNNFFDKEPKECCQKKFNQIDQKLDDLQKAVAEIPSAEIDETIVNNLETLTETVGDISDAVTQNSQDISTLQTSKQNTLTAGANISISGNTISATDTTYTAGNNITISNGVISATDTTYTAGNNITIENGVISANASGGLTQEQETWLNLVYQDYLSRQLQPDIDPNYAPKTFSDYPEGTILQSSAKYDRKFMLSFSNIITTPVFVFSAEDISAGDLSIKINFTSSVSLSLNAQIAIFNNDTSIFTESVTLTSSNANYIYEKTLTGITLSAGNVFYVTITTNTVSNILTRVIAELVAPNAEVINQISPFAVDYYDGKYYISDCSSGTAKVAEIEAENMTSMNSLTWTDTGIECYQYKTSFSVERVNGYYQTLERIDYYTTYDNVVHFINKDKNETLTMQGFDAVDWASYWNLYNTDYVGAKLSTKKTGRISVNHAFTNLTYGDYQNKPYAYCLNMTKLLESQSMLLSRTYGTYVFPNLSIQATIPGNATVPEVNIGKGINPHSYMGTQSAYNPDLFVYAKLYDKIIRYDYSFDIDTKEFTALSSTEIGAYEEYFEGVNNDYFVVKNGVLEYYKKPELNE